ncbi:MAG TPA: outer membrane protein assembly factor BamE [Allosphingosinicella sp.]|nr:outer membrane protein assembly factor BamE [Allosphingosinicella sp.]
MERLGRLGIGLGIVATMALALTATCAWHSGYLPVRPFDSAAWKQPADPDRTRIEMIDALLWTRDLHGMSRAEVERLLGRPPASLYFTDWDYVYRLGMERGLFSIDSEWLVLRFGRDDRVSEWALVRD